MEYSSYHNIKTDDNNIMYINTISTTTTDHRGTDIV